MLASSWSRDEAQGELETSNGSDSPPIENVDDSSCSPSAGRTDIEDHDDGCSSVRLSKLPVNHSDADKDFDPELPTIFLSPSKDTPEKDVVI